MNIAEYLTTAVPSVSFEIIPPLRGGSMRDLQIIIEELLQYQPPFIDVTSHAAELVSVNSEFNSVPQALRKRPGTLGICALLQHKYNVDAVPHVLCQGFTREETEDFLLELSYLGINNVLALQGDTKYQKNIPPNKTANKYAFDLVQQIVALNAGNFLTPDQKGICTNFCIGVAGYPEKHRDAADLTTDIAHLKSKVDAGASYIVTQMFFDNRHYFSFVEQCRLAGITVPIIPGLKVLTSSSQLESLPSYFNITIPDDLQREIKIKNRGPRHCFEIGVEWGIQQIKDLRSHNVPLTHLYVMQNLKPIHAVLEKVF